MSFCSFVFLFFVLWHSFTHTQVVCEQNPVLVPVVAPLNIKLPKPVDTCITKEIVLPRVKCQKVSTRPAHGSSVRRSVLVLPRVKCQKVSTRPAQGSSVRRSVLVLPRGQVSEGQYSSCPGSSVKRLVIVLPSVIRLIADKASPVILQWWENPKQHYSENYNNYKENYLFVLFIF